MFRNERHQCLTGSLRFDLMPDQHLDRSARAFTRWRRGLNFSRIGRSELIATFLRSSPMRRGLKHLVCLGLLNLMFVPASSSLLRAQNKSQNKNEKEAPPLKLKVGDTAPDFTLLAFDGKELKKISLQDYRGKKNVALAFFVFAFTGG
jgi:hypothetical protein